MATWPVTLPQEFEVAGYSESIADNLLRSEMDVGPPKVRRRGAARPDLIQGQITIDDTQWATLLAFYDADLFEGALTFTWSAVTYRFAQPPSRVPLGADNWRVALSLERMP